MNLSKGQMQLLCIARALLHNAHTESKIVLMDEATSHMDENTDHHIQAVMGEAFADCTMLVIAHRLETYHDVDRYLMLENGMLGIPDFTEV
jgi:ATP-binding cassette subfamily C (CFTR/MRP) protein 1